LQNEREPLKTAPESVITAARAPSLSEANIVEDIYAEIHSSREIPASFEI
jgi:hypothetical protein